MMSGARGQAWKIVAILVGSVAIFFIGKYLIDRDMDADERRRHGDKFSPR